MNKTGSRSTQRQGTLNSLQHLENITHNAQDEKETLAKQQRHLANLHKTLQRLVQQRDRLCFKLEHGPCQVLATLLQDENSDIDVTSEAQHAAVTSSIAFARRLKALEFVQAYRLCGVTVKRVNERRVRLCWDTFCQGEYHEAYYMELERKGPGLQVHRHTLPYFLPTLELAERHLNNDLRGFVDGIGSMLNAYVSRRLQVERLKLDHSTRLVGGDVECSESCDWLRFTLEMPESASVHLELLYDDLYAVRPMRMNLTKDGSTPTSMKRLELVLKEHDLSQAVSIATEVGMPETTQQ